MHRAQPTSGSEGSGQSHALQTLPSTEADVGCLYAFIEEVIQCGAITRADRFLSERFVEHDGPATRGRSAFVSSIRTRRDRFPDAVWTIELLMEVRGIVICHTSVRSFAIPMHSWEHILVRFESGKIAECWRSCHSSLAE